MFQSFSNSFGSITVATTGASLVQAELSGKELLHDFGDQWHQWAAGAVMFPFPVRMASGTVMVFEGTEYHWPINDEKHRAALHGFTPWEEFELAQLPNGIQASWNYDGAKEHYPFPCRLTISYTLDEHGLTLSGRIENLGEANLPFHMGWHPYFKTNAPALHPAPTHRLKKNEVSHPGEKILLKVLIGPKKWTAPFLWILSSLGMLVSNRYPPLPRYSDLRTPLLWLLSRSQV